jgi:hypothetical protein
LEPRDQHDFLILEPIAGTTPSPIGRSLWKGSVDTPEFADFSMCYMRLPTERCGGNPPAIAVEIIQYPTVEWADYAERGKAFGPGPDYYQHPENTTEFGQSVLALENRDKPGHGEFYWTSGNIFVVIRSDVSNPAPFIDAYLKRLPSHLIKALVRKKHGGRVKVVDGESAFADLRRKSELRRAALGG